MSKVGIKETKEAMVGMLKLSTVMAGLMKDGMQANDFTSIMMKFQTDLKFQEAMKAAYEGVNMIPAEMADIDLMEGLDLAMSAAPEVSEMLKAMKK